MTVYRGSMPRNWPRRRKKSPVNAIENFNFAIDPEERWRITFNYHIAARTHSDFGGIDDYSEDERSLKYLTSNGFY
jgi:hypothetical protein